MKRLTLFFLTGMMPATVFASEPAAPAPGMSEAPSLCVVGRASGNVRTLQQKQKSETEEARELEAVIDALLRCPTVDEKVQAETPRRAPAPAQVAYRLDAPTLPAGNG
ncbi:hypothetical protein [Sphingobium nicotianae]|uniref:UrcA family protein n=1 Tax=Sphingobium nicotianae TaxID=2782607 RepID=A0A9X1AIM0_9SPHN|nr:hypothetical protein [Sphingobium nicotianae]MBT2185489.1 hypothetical protein [Sphingobium nicotianae]